MESKFSEHIRDLLKQSVSHQKQRTVLPAYSRRELSTIVSLLLLVGG